MKRRGRKGPEDGAAAVEMAIVLPLLFLLIFGIVEFGFIFNRWITVTHAAREGVRRYAIEGDPAAAELAAEGTAGANVAKFGTTAIDCTASANPDPSSREVQMVCNTTYTLRLFSLLPIKNPLILSSTAKARKEN